MDNQNEQKVVVKYVGNYCHETLAHSTFVYYSDGTKENIAAPFFGQLVRE